MLHRNITNLWVKYATPGALSMIFCAVQQKRLNPEDHTAPGENAPRRAWMVQLPAIAAANWRSCSV
jgi:hypothetical protein